MLAKYFFIIRNYVLSVSLQRKYNFYHQDTFLDAFRTNSRNVIGRNPSMVIPLLTNQDLTPMLALIVCIYKNFHQQGIDCRKSWCKATGSLLMYINLVIKIF